MRTSYANYGRDIVFERVNNSHWMQWARKTYKEGRSTNHRASKYKEKEHPKEHIEGAACF
jgi:hypothetical protein